MIEEHDFLKFGPIQLEMFAPLHPTLEAFAAKHNLRFSRVFDGGDPVCPACCYFLGWYTERFRHCFIRICAEELFKIGDKFDIGAQSRPFRRYKQWKYEASTGPSELENLLIEAYQFILQSVETP